uniref:N-acetylneuraminate synthase n=1 Tax=Eptatretus burgeri TaxID=7764 RepID=A0A8C4Q1E1_EPTBU
MPLEFELCPGRMIGGDHPCFIIAEIGQNHQGDLAIAKKMIKMAKVSRVTAFSTSAVVGMSKNIYRDDRHPHTGVIFFIFFSLQLQMAVEFLDKLNVPFLKVGSGDTNNLPYLEHTAKIGRPMVISSGMQNLDTMHKVYNLVKLLNSKFCFLQCTSAYPLEPNDVNLRVIETYRREFPDIPVGYSGHETGTVISIAAIAMGAKVLERHVTLDKTWKGSDHAASLEPKELAELVRSVRCVELALGSPEKRSLPCEQTCHDKLGKSVVARVAIKAGATLTLDMITVKVADPQGIRPEEIFKLQGRRAMRDIPEDDTVTSDALEPPDC